MSNIILHVEPGRVMSWEEFQQEKPPFSMALDGFVSSQTKFTPDGPYANFNHHEEVDRMATRSTCMQIFFAMKMGLFDAFQKNGEPFAHAFVNDADQDVCLTYWLLKNHEQAMAISWTDPLARFLIYEDLVDASAGAYPFNDLHNPKSLLKSQAWVFEPYTDARAQWTLHAMEADELKQVIEEVYSRITRFANSEGDFIELEVDPDIIGGGNGWKMIAETSIYDRIALYDAGIKSFVGVRGRLDGNFTYVIGRMSPFIPFPLLKIYQTLNEAEGTLSPGNAWGGSNIIGGSPRETGSSLPPKEVEAIINDVLKKG